MFNSAQTNEEQPENSHTNSTDWVFSNDNGSIEYAFIYVLMDGLNFLL